MKLHLSPVLLNLTLLIYFTPDTLTASGCDCVVGGTLFFSEYLEGSSSNKALEIYNPSCDTVHLSSYKIYRYNNGSTTPTDSMFLVGILQPDSAYVIANPFSAAPLLAISDTTHTIAFFNGDDVLSLYHQTSDTHVDRIGELGVDPGASWTVEDNGSTQNFTLVRKDTVRQGTLNWEMSAKNHWIVLPINTVDSLGQHDGNLCKIGMNTGTASLYFSEYIEGSSSNKALEIFNPSSSEVNLSDYKLYRYNNGTTSPSDSLIMSGIVASGDVYVIANPSADAEILSEKDTTSSITFFNGDDALELYKIPTQTVIDVIGEVGVDPGSGWTVGSGSTWNHTLIRKDHITGGNTDWTSSSANEWDVFAMDSFDSLGMHGGILLTPNTANCTQTNYSVDNDVIANSNAQIFRTKGTLTSDATIGTFNCYLLSGHEAVVFKPNFSVNSAVGVDVKVAECPNE